MDTLNKRRFFITMRHPLGIQDTKIWAKAISAHAKKCSRMEVLSLRGGGWDIIKEQNSWAECVTGQSQVQRTYKYHA